MLSGNASEISAKIESEPEPGLPSPKQAGIAEKCRPPCLPYMKTLTLSTEGSSPYSSEAISISTCSPNMAMAMPLLSPQVSLSHLSAMEATSPPCSNPSACDSEKRPCLKNTSEQDSEGTEQFVCFYCDVKCHSEWAIKRHLRGNHKEEDELLWRKESAPETFFVKDKPVRRRATFKRSIAISSVPTDGSIPEIRVRSGIASNYSSAEMKSELKSDLPSTKQAVTAEKCGSPYLPNMITPTLSTEGSTMRTLSAEISLSSPSSSNPSSCNSEEETCLKNTTERSSREGTELFVCYYCGVKCHSESSIKRHLRGNHKEEDELLWRKGSAPETFSVKDEPVRRQTTFTDRSPKKRGRPRLKRRSSPEKDPLPQSEKWSRQKRRLREGFPHKPPTQDVPTSRKFQRIEWDRTIFDDESEVVNLPQVAQEPEGTLTEQRQPDNDDLLQPEARDDITSEPGGLLYCCDQCPFTVRSLFHFRLHLAQHVTATCGLVSATPSVSHSRCGICGYFADGQADFLDHVTKHTKEKPFLCSYCVKDFSSREKVRIHCNSEHKGQAVVYTHRGEMYRKMFQKPRMMVLLEPAIVLSKLSKNVPIHHT
ncbi:zinc finger and BTB domain-containing protein 18.3 isoform X1 [Aplysia californica]|uniref:Zinc finger and BTB domain-containing protein 18.3 isoform X1 n=1 Tax=Aplysia californica TaxID=6500 RepID=A0ABM1VTR5_APLCA|nr:zinc finger and BTB domain-containing protein 18.3 isoform X1 [Aplysia californica]